MIPVDCNFEAFRQSFRDEAGEILVELESSLLALGEAPADEETIGLVFRCLHTIKGSGALFGFDTLAAFTHHLESAWEEARSGRSTVSAELLELSLAALDQIRAMIEPHAPDTAPAAAASLLDRLAALTGRSAPSALPAPSAQPPAAPQPPGPARHSRLWNIHFAPGPDMLRNGTDPLLLLDELRVLGELSGTASMAALPPLAEIDPARCYVAWDLALRTPATLDALRDVFIFVEDACDLAIEPQPDPESLPESMPLPDRSPGSASIGSGSAPGAPPALVPAAPPPPAGRPAAARDMAKAEPSSSLRVPAAKLDQFVDLVGEMVTMQARLSELAAHRDDPQITELAEGVERLTLALRETSMNIRMLPIRSTFERFRRLVHDLARDLGKSVELTIAGADTELDKTVIEKLSDPLMHLIRNSMDHGVEPPAARVAQGKPPLATIHLAARYAGASVLISVSDDGRGIDAEAVLARATERGLAKPGEALSEAQIFDFIFAPGFSTARTVTDVSGRGVGLDVVRKSVDRLRGSIDVASRPGRGTTITLRLPLTLAIIDGLLVTVADASFVLPLANTLECIELTAADIAQANGKHVINVRGQIVPYIRLREHFAIGSPRPPIEQVMLVETEEGRYGLVVDQVLGNCQTVIKSLGRCYRDVQIVSGATILGNGSVALILDAHRLVQEAIRARTHGPRARPPRIAASGSRQRDGTAELEP